MPGFIKYQLEDWVDPSDDLNDFLNDALECRCVPYLCNIVQLKAKRQGLSELAVRWEHYRLHPQELTLAQLLQACAALGLKLPVNGKGGVGRDGTGRRVCQVWRSNTTRCAHNKAPGRLR